MNFYLTLDVLTEIALRGDNKVQAVKWLREMVSEKSGVTLPLAMSLAIVRAVLAAETFKGGFGKNRDEYEVDISYFLRN